MVETDHWEVRSSTCVLDVRIEDQDVSHEPGWAGPRQFAVVVGTVRCAP